MDIYIQIHMYSSQKSARNDLSYFKTNLMACYIINQQLRCTNIKIWYARAKIYHRARERDRIYIVLTYSDANTRQSDTRRYFRAAAFFRKIIEKSISGGFVVVSKRQHFSARTIAPDKFAMPLREVSQLWIYLRTYLESTLPSPLLLSFSLSLFPSRSIDLYARVCARVLARSLYQ